MNREERSRLVRPFRKPREVPTDLSDTYPAPPWVPAIVDTLDGCGVSLTMIRLALGWCLDGDAPARAEQVLTVVTNWPGPYRDVVVHRFLVDALKAKAGARAGRKPRHLRAFFVPRDYDEPRPKP